MKLSDIIANDAINSLMEINSLYQDIESLTTGIPGGLSREELARRLKEIREINNKIGEITGEYI